MSAGLISESPLDPTIARTQLACLDQGFFGLEPSWSKGMPEFGKIWAMGYATKAGLRRRLCRRVNMIARRNPVKAPRNASVIERLLKVSSPWPVRRNPSYAIVTVQRITRTENIGEPPFDEQYCHKSAPAERDFLRSTDKNVQRGIFVAGRPSLAISHQLSALSFWLKAVS